MISRTSYLTLQKITELAEKGEKESADDESLATAIPTAPTPPPRKRPPMTDPADLHEMLHIPPRKERYGVGKRWKLFKHINKENKQVLFFFDYLRCGTLHTSVFRRIHIKEN